MAAILALGAVCMACSAEAQRAPATPAGASVPWEVAARVATPVPVTASPTPAPSIPLPSPPPVPAPPPPPAPTPEPPPPPPPPAPPPPSPPATAHNALAQSLTELINAKRSERGLASLAPNATLTTAAQRYAELHFASAPFALSHTLDGTPGDRAAREGYVGLVGEVIVAASPSAAQLMDLWMGSPPHQTILMGANFNDVGVGCAAGPWIDANGNTFDAALCVGMLGAR